MVVCCKQLCCNAKQLLLPSLLTGLFWFIIPLKVRANPSDLQTEQSKESLQTDLTQRDLKAIERLIEIAQHNSSTVRDAKANLGIASFNEAISLEIGPYASFTQKNEPNYHPYSDEQGLSVSVTIYPLRITSALQQFPVKRAKVREANSQIRIAVVQAYMVYLQARQAKIIAAYKIQALTYNSQRANLQFDSQQFHKNCSLAKEECITAATEILKANGNQRVALETLAAAVGLLPQETLAVIEERSSPTQQSQTLQMRQ